MSNTVRNRFIDLIASKNYKICDAARACSIPYENAKCIYSVYQKEGRAQRLYKVRAHRFRQLPGDGKNQPVPNSLPPKHDIEASLTIQSPSPENNHLKGS